MALVHTPKFQPAPCVMLVGVDAALAQQLADLLAPLPLLKVAHAAAARERMPVTRPLALVIRASGPSEELNALLETASGVGAEVCVLAPNQHVDVTALMVRLRSAMTSARRRRGEPS